MGPRLGTECRLEWGAEMTKERLMHELCFDKSQFLKDLPLPSWQCRCYICFNETQNSFEGTFSGKLGT